MPDREEKTIGQLPSLLDLEDVSLIPVEQNGAAGKVTGLQIKTWAASGAEAFANQAEAAKEAIENLGVVGNTLLPGASVTVTKEVDPDTGVVTLTFGLPTGQQGPQGVSPTISISNIQGGHRITITDADHPTGQSFDVLDGSGTGDMRMAIYDSDGDVANAGGIPDYVAANAPKPKKRTSGTISAASWVDGGDGTFSFTGSVWGSGIGINDKIDIQLTKAQELSLKDDGVTKLKPENNNGTIVLYAYDAAPTTNLTVQYTITEVEV